MSSKKKGPPLHDMPWGTESRRKPLRKQTPIDLSGVDFADIEMRILLSMGLDPERAEDLYGVCQESGAMIKLGHGKGDVDETH